MTRAERPVAGLEAVGEPTPIVAREDECRAIDTLLVAADEGRSSVLVVRGEPGIGKSTLLRYAIRNWGPSRVIQARGLESEAELPFAGLADLLRPLLGALDAIPAPQARALRGALALDAPTPGDPFTVSAAVLSLLGAAADEGPLLAVVDDAHWLDEESQGALLFAARRLEAEGIVFLLAVRDTPDSPIASAGLPELRVSGLPESAARELLARGDHELAPNVADAVISTAGGNPLALLEVPGLLTADQVAGREPYPDPLPVGEAIASAFRRRIDVLNADVRAALLVAAVDDSREANVVLAAMADLGLDRSALEQAEVARLIEFTPQLRFLHPLIRAVTVHDAEAGAIRRAHRAIAAALSDSSSEHRRTWHLALATTTADEDLAAALVAAAADARARSGFAGAAAASERAARLTPDQAVRARRLVIAASDCQLAGRIALGNALADEAITLAEEETLRAEAQQLRARGDLFAGKPMDAYTRLVAEGERLAEAHSDHAAGLLAEAALVCMVAGRPRQALQAGKRAHELATPNGPASGIAMLAYVEALILGGEIAGAEALLSQTAHSARGASPMLLALSGQARAGFLMVLEAYDEARATAEQLVGLARAASAPAMLSFPLATLAEIDFRTGHWTEAAARANEAAQVAEETGQPLHVAYSVIVVAKVAAARGDRAACRALTDRAAEVAVRLGIESMLFYIPAVLGLLALSDSRFEDAIVAGNDVARLSRERGLIEPGVIWWAPDLVEAYVRSGQLGNATHELDRFEREAETSGRVWARAAAARCRGLLAADDGFESEFAHALELHSETTTPFEQARTQLCLGERRRRAGRRVDARETLRAALATFDRLEAHPWSTRARAELRASGQSARPRHRNAAEQLTPHELQVALVVAQGATNREAGVQLFLSAKTIDFHLGNIYRKLGIRSRAELAHRLAAAETAT